MTVSRRLHVVRIEHQAGLSWPTPVTLAVFGRSAPAAAPAARTSVADFWADQAGGLFDLQVTVDPVVTLVPDAAGATAPAWAGVISWDTLKASAASPDPLADAFASLLATAVSAGAGLPSAANGAPPPLVVVLGTKPTSRAVAYRATVDGTTYRVAHVSTTTDHATMCHEIGHLLGLEHVWGNSLWGEYGSAYCVMGSPWQDNSVGLTSPAGTTPPVASGVWAAAGPRLSAATAVSWSRATGEPIDTMLIRHEVLKDGGRLELALADVDGPAHLPRALVVTPEGETTEWSNIPVVLEIRRPLPQLAPDWDAALDLDRPMTVPATSASFERDTDDAPGVVVHALRSVTLLEQWDATDVRQKPPKRPGAPVHLGTIPLPLVERSDLFVGTDFFTLEVVSWDPARGVAWLALDHDARPRVRLTPLHRTITARTSPGPLVSAVLTGARCRGGAFPSVWRDKEVTVTFLAVSGGGAGARFTWTLAGEQLVAGTAATSEVSRGTLVTDLPVDVPAGHGTWSTETHRFTLEWTARGGQLHVDRVTAPGVVRIPCTVSAFELDPAERVSATAEGTVVGRELTVPGLAAARRQCTEWLFTTTMARAPQLLEGKVLEKGEIAVPHHWELDEMQSVISQLTDLGEIPSLGRRFDKRRQP